MIAHIDDRFRSHLANRAGIVIVDDELDDLTQTYWVVNGKPPDWASRQEDDKAGAVYLAVNHTNNDAPPLEAYTFSDLADQCEQRCSALLSNHNYVILVADILFKGVGWRQMGIDLLEAMRVRFGPRIGIIAFSSFSTPFIVSAAYRRGADHVIQKAARRPASTHQPIITPGTHRLLQTLAFLSFQKEYLRRMRDLCHPSIVKHDKAGSDRREHMRGHIADLKRVLPPDSASPHIERERLDTLYLLHGASIYDGTSPTFLEFEREWLDISQRYD